MVRANLPTWEQLSLLAASLASVRHLHLDRSMVGQTLSMDTGPVGPELARAYAEATADDWPRLRDAGVAPPLLISRLVLPLIKRVLLHPALHVNLLRLVHATQRFSWQHPVALGERLAIRLVIDDIVPTAAGELLRLRGEARCGDEPRGEAISELMIRAWRRRARGARRPPEQDASPPLLRVEIPTAPDQALRYAAASGDDNLIHTSPLFARLAGLKRPILHGMCVLAMTCGAITRELAGGDPGRLRGVQGRFSRPAYPGQPLSVVVHRGADEEQLAFEVRDPAGCPVVRQGQLWLAAPAKARGRPATRSG